MRFKDLSKRWQVIIFILPLFIAFFTLNCSNIFRFDDLYYQFICPSDYYINDNQTLVTNFSDIITSQSNHYMAWGGRAPIHTLVQSFVSLLDKSIFNILNVICLAGFMFLTLALLDKSLVKNFKAWAVVAVCMVTFIPHHSVMYFCAAYTINYLWGLTFCLLFVYIWMNYRNEKWKYTIPLFFLCFFLGWSQELFALPVAGAICVHYLINRKEIFTQRCLLSFAFGCGVLLLVLAPGNYTRADKGSFSHIINLLVKASSMWATFIAVGSVTIFALRKIKLQGIKKIFQKNPFFMTIFLFTILLSLIFPATGSRVFWGLIYWWLFVLALIFINTTQYKPRFDKLIYITYTYLLVSICFVAYYSSLQTRYEKTVIKQYEQSDSGIVFVDEPRAVPLLFASSCFKPGSAYWRGMISKRYNTGKPLIVANNKVKSELADIDKLFVDENKFGESGFYRTGMPHLYVSPNIIKKEARLQINYDSLKSNYRLVNKIYSLLPQSIVGKDVRVFDYSAVQVVYYNGMYLTFIAVEAWHKKTEISIDIIDGNVAKNNW